MPLLPSMSLLQISSVKRNSVVAVIGETSVKGKTQCELWFFVAQKKSNISDAFIEGRYLYEAESDAHSGSHQVFHIHSDDDMVQLAKASVIDIVKEFHVEDGVYSISQSTIRDLKIIVSFEDGSEGRGNNERIIRDTACSEYMHIPDQHSVLAALANASGWKTKVNLYQALH